MNRKTNGFEILDKSIGANGPSMGLGVTCMMFGIATTLIGFGMLEIIAILVGLFLLLLSVYLILSIDCIGLNKFQNQLRLYKDYLFTTVGKEFSLSEYESVCIYFQIDRPRNSRRKWNTTQLKTFTVILLSKTGQKLILKELGDLNSAKKLQYVVASQIGLKLIKDPIREK